MTCIHEERRFANLWRRPWPEQFSEATSVKGDMQCSAVAVATKNVRSIVGALHNPGSVPQLAALHPVHC
jgi:hypothetical protein